MAAVLLAAGAPGERYSYASARIMIHQPSWGWGIYRGDSDSKQADDLSLQATESQRQRAHWSATLARLTGQDCAEIDAKMVRDVFMTADDARECAPPDSKRRNTHQTAGAGQPHRGGHSLRAGGGSTTCRSARVTAEGVGTSGAACPPRTEYQTTRRTSAVARPRAPAVGDERLSQGTQWFQLLPTEGGHMKPAGQTLGQDER